jgi:hypothetical protein
MKNEKDHFNLCTSQINFQQDYSMPTKKYIYHLISLKFYSFLAFLFSAGFLIAIVIHDAIRKMLMKKNNESKDQVADTKENTINIHEAERLKISK